MYLIHFQVSKSVASLTQRSDIIRHAVHNNSGWKNAIQSQRSCRLQGPRSHMSKAEKGKYLVLKV